MTLSISPELVQARIQLCKEWAEAPVKLKTACKRIFRSSMEVLSAQQLADFFYLYLMGLHKKINPISKPSGDLMPAVIESLIKEDAASRWAAGYDVLRRAE